jgi:hypothetical protein
LRRRRTKKPQRRAQVTITLGRDVVAQARANAAKSKLTLSGYIGEAIEERLGRDDQYWAAYEAWKKAPMFDLKGPAQRYPKREELYDRTKLRDE